MFFGLEAQVWLIAKIFVLFAFLIYIFFAMVVVRQVSLMTSTLQVGFEPSIKIFSYAHLAFSLFAFVTALLIL